MSERTYLLALEICSLTDSEQVRHYITTSQDFSSWWNHLPFIYLLDSALDQQAITARIHDRAPEARFLLTPIDAAEVDGWLPEVSWKWLEKRARTRSSSESVLT